MAAKIDAQLAPEITDDEELQSLYNWVDETPLSRPKKNISRDFQDGVLFAEVVNHFFPRLVEMHNYSAANSHTQKLYNWTTLNQKVLRKLGYQIHQQDIEDIIKAAPGAIERVLKVLQEKVVQAQNGALRVGRPQPKTGSTPPDGRPNKEDGGARAGSADPSARPRSDPGLAGNAQRYQQEVDAELLLEKEQTISEFREMVVIMSEKIKKLEQLVRIKDSKIEALTAKLQKYNLA